MTTCTKIKMLPLHKRTTVCWECCTYLPCKWASLRSFLNDSLRSRSLFLFSLRSSSALSLTYLSNTCFRSLDVKSRYLGSKTILCSSFSQVLKADTSFSVSISLKDAIRCSSGMMARSFAARTSASIAASLPMSIFFVWGQVPVETEDSYIRCSAII